VVAVVVVVVVSRVRGIDLRAIEVDVFLARLVGLTSLVDCIHGKTATLEIGRTTIDNGGSIGSRGGTGEPNPNPQEGCVGCTCP
jgi:hypothetical protein